jgi:TP901 family phage tail tape measure protein
MASGENLGAKFTLDITNLKAGLADANRLIRQSESEFITAASGMNDWSKSLDGLTARFDSLNKQTDIQKQKIAALNKVREETIAKMKDEGATDEEIEKAVDKVNVQIIKESKQLQNLQSRTDKAADELQNFMESEQSAGDGADELGEAAENASKAAENAGGGFTVFKGILADLAATAITAAISALKNFAADVIETGSAFDESMSKVAALSGATAEELELLEETARQYGATTQFSASEAADALGYMALAGWNAEESADALGGVLNLAAASGMDLAQASDMVTDYLSAFNLTAEQSAEFADLLAYAQANANTTAEQLGEAYKNSAATMSAAGQDVATVTALLSSMANQGLKGSEAGTALNAIMRDMTKKMQDGKIAIGETSVEVMDANGNYRDMTEILADVEAATAGMGDAEKAAALSSTFTSDSIKGLNLILNDGVANAAAFEEELNNSTGAAAEMAATLNDNLNGDLKELSSAFDELKISIFEGANMPIRDLIQIVSGDLLPAFTDMVNGVEGADVAFGAAVGNLVNTAINNLMSLLPGALSVAQTVIPTVISGLLSALPTLLSFITGQLLPALLETVVAIIPPIISSIMELIPQLITELVGAMPLILDAAIELLMAIVEALPTIIDALLKALPNMIDSLIKSMISFYNKLFDGAIALLMAIVEAIPDIVNSLIEALPQIITAMINGLTQAYPAILEGAITLLMAIINSIPTIVSSLYSAMPQIITAIGNALVDNLPTIFDCAMELFGMLIEAIPEICISLAENLPTIISAIVDGLSAGFDSIVTVGEDLIKGLWNGISNMADWIGKKIQGFGKGVLNDLKDFFGIASPSKVMRDQIGKNLALGISAGFDSEMSTVAADMQTALNDAIPTATAAINAIGQTAEGTQAGTATGGVVINQTNNYSMQHSRYEIYQTKQNTAAAVRAALAGV